MAIKLPLKTTVAPNLPVAPINYIDRHFDVVNNVLRLYFNQIDSTFSAVLGVNGGKYFVNPHIAASDTTSQYAGGNNVATKVKWNTLEAGSGFTLNADGSATPEASGTYKIDYSLQFVNTNNVQEDIYVWLRVDGANVPRSASKFTVPARKSAGVYGYLIAYSSITFPIVAGQDITLYWQTDKAYNPVGPVDGVYMQDIAAASNYPESPSAVGTITFVSAL